MSSLPELVTTSLQSGPYGVLALTGLAAVVTVAITQYKSLYGISVGYGLAVATLAVALHRAFRLPMAISSSSLWLTAGLFFYGVRLAAYLFVRDVSGWKPLTTPKNDVARWKRVPLALSLAVFYAFEVTPALYALRGAAATATTPLATALCSWTGIGLLWSGAILEAVADTHKFLAKLKQAENTNTQERHNTFHGPVRGVYRWTTRHPNYTGEIAVWTGVWLAGVPYFGKSVLAWLCGTAGWYGIVAIMRSATQKLEARQQEKYGGQEEYEEWKRKVRAPLFPFVKD